MTDEKYVVYKKEEWTHFINQIADALPAAHGCDLPHELADAVVIRTQDVFAAPALDAYANSIRVATSINPVGTSRLDEIADYFHERAVEAWARQDKKLPD